MFKSDSLAIVQFSLFVILAMEHPFSLNPTTFSIIVCVSPDTDKAITNDSPCASKCLG